MISFLLPIIDTNTIVLSLIIQTDKGIHHLESLKLNKYYSEELNYSDNSYASLDETKIY